MMQNVGACDMFTDDRPEGIAVGVLAPVKQPGQEVGDQPDGKDLKDKQGESYGRSSMQVATRLPESRGRNHTSRDAGARIKRRCAYGMDGSLPSSRRAIQVSAA